MKKYMFVFLFAALIMVLSLETYGEINITEQPKSQYTRLSGDVVMSVKAKGDELRYHWFVRKGTNKKYKKAPYETSRKITIRCDKITMNGWRYKCKITDKNGNIKWSKSAKIKITDIGVKYTCQLDAMKAYDLFMPKASDGYCYIYCYNKTYVNQIKEAIDKLNKIIGKLFVYTTTASIADIIIVGYNNTYLPNNIFLRSSEAEFIEREGYNTAAVAFDLGGLHYLIGMNHSYFKSLTDAEIRGVTIHELGHCVGLPHSENVNDIMHITNNGTDELSKKDIKLFKKARKRIRRIGSSSNTFPDGVIDICYKKSGR